MARLESEIRRLAEQVSGEETGAEDPDTVDRVETESLIASKREILAQTKTSMTASARACDARKQPFDRYRTPREREDNRL